MKSLPRPKTGFVVTHFLTVSNIERSTHFYRDILGGEVVLAGEPTFIALGNTYIALNVSGGPTDNLQVQVGNCYAEFEASDRVTDAKVFADGSMKIRNAIQSRHRIKLEGDSPQRDGFEPEWRGARELDVFINCPAFCPCFPPPS